MAEKKKTNNIVLNTVILVAITFVAVCALALVNQITAKPIAQAEIAARAEVYKTVFSDASGFDEIAGADKMLEDSASVLAGRGLTSCTINDVLVAKNDAGEDIGYVIAATSSSGYGGDIQIAVGIMDGKLTGFDVVSNSETAGLGSKCTEDEFKSQFTGKSTALIEYTKDGATADNQIDAISGATITTNAVTEATNAAIIFYQTNFGDGDFEEKPQNTTVPATEQPDTEEALSQQSTEAETTEKVTQADKTTTQADTTTAQPDASSGATADASSGATKKKGR